MRSPMDKRTLGRIGTAALSGMSDREVVEDPARAFEIAQGAMRGALGAAVSVSGARESKEEANGS